MCKKLLIAAVAVFVGLTLVKKTELGGVIRSWWRDVRASVKAQVPPETKLEELKAQIRKIDQEIEKHVRTLARMEVGRDDLKKQLDVAQGRITKLKSDMSAMIEALEKDGTVTRVSFNGEVYRTSELTKRLTRARTDLENYKNKVKNLEGQLEARREALEAAKNRIDEMVGQKDQLIVLAERLKTQIELVRLNQYKNQSINIDDSVISECNRLASEIDSQLREMEKADKYLHDYGLSTAAPVFEKETKPTAEELKASKKALEEDRADETALAGKK